MEPRKFRSRPVVITAEQYTGEGADPTVHDQRCYLSPGDWVVPEPDGVHFYPIKPDIFAKKYEAVE